MKKLIRRLRNLSIAVALIWFLSQTTIGRDLFRSGMRWVGSLIPTPDFASPGFIRFAVFFGAILIMLIAFVNIVNRIVTAFRDDDDFDEPVRKPTPRPDMAAAGYGPYGYGGGWGGNQTPIIVLDQSGQQQQAPAKLQKPTRGRVQRMPPQKYLFWEGLTIDREDPMYRV